MQKIKKAIIAVAGSGTRFLPATKSMPKEMLPIVDKPMIQLVVEELVEAGVEDIVLVTKWDRKPLEDHFDYNWALQNELKEAGKEKLREQIKKVAEMANFIYVRQAPQYGNGVPVLSAESVLKNEPFIFCHGDDLVKSKTSFAAQMVEEYERTGNLVMGVDTVPREETYRYGILKLKDGTNLLEEIIEKPSVEEAPSEMVNIGRFLLNQDVIDVLKRTPVGKSGELWLVDAVTNYVKEGGKVSVVKIKDGQWFTAGDPLRFIIANIEYALDRDDMNNELLEYLRKLK
jgi:UTP--glucose-1-phosphate uridylyltransferase